MLINYVKNLIRDKSVCILGFGREGKSTLELFKRAGGYKSVTVCDVNPVGDLSPFFTSTGEDYQKNLDKFDIIVKSPGIVLEENALSDFSKLYSQTEIFLSVYRDRTIGITGTKGKSTTTTLIYHVLKECNKPAVLLGNIGIPAFEGEVKEDDIVVFELSSHQLEYTHVSPHISVFLNIFPEHLDHYGTFEKYYDAKKNISRFQKEGDLLIKGENVDTPQLCKALTFGNTGDVIIKPKSFIYNGREIFVDASPLLGAHNVNNIAAAFMAVNSFGVSEEDFLKALSSFTPLPHRLERACEKDGIVFYDDSISTIPQTTVQAVESLPNVGSLLIGGMDRGIDYSLLYDFLEKTTVPHIIFMYDTGRRIVEEFGKREHTAELHMAKDLKEAVIIAKKITPKGSVCLLSPAAASYGFFKNFEDRGDKFKEYALNL